MGRTFGQGDADVVELAEGTGKIDGRLSLGDKRAKGSPVEIKIYGSPHMPEGVRRLKCVSSCEFGAISREFIGKQTVARDLSVKSPASS